MTDGNLTTSGNANLSAGSMTVGSQTRKEADTSTAELLKPKHKLNIGCWNVRTMFQAGKLAQVAKESDAYNIDILGISEARWTGTGKRRLDSGHTLLYSGRTDGQHREGVALLMSKEAAKALMEWNPVNERLLVARFHSRYTKLSIITCYAPTEDALDEEKERFYEQLQSALGNIPSHDMLIVAGDMNAKVGANNQQKERTMGKQGLGEMNNNGERLYQLCSENDLVIGGTTFQHRDVHKYTWTSPDGKTRNQIDHLIINRKWRRSLQDVKTKRGADVGSDHQLVIGKLCLKLRKEKASKVRDRLYDTGKLKDQDTRAEFQLEIRNRFRVLQDDEQDLTIDNFNQAMNQAAEATLGYKRKHKESWISSGTWEKIAERKDIKKRLNQTKSERVKDQIKKRYTQADKEVKKSARKDKKKYIEDLTSEAERAAQRQDMRTLYRITSDLKGGYQNVDTPIKDKEGKHITSEEAKIERWKEHFETILNREEPRLRADIKAAERDLDIQTACPTLVEVREAIKAMKSWKSPGNDRVTAEMIKAEDAETPRVLTEIFTNIWLSEQTPEDWKVGLIIKLPKKGDLGDCNNWRGITLLSLTCKIFSKIILKRLQAVDKGLRQEQAGFRKGKSCVDQIFILRQILEQSAEWNTTIYANFIDFEKAFDSLHRDSLWKIMRHYGIPQKLVSITQLLYTDFSSAVVCDDKLTDSFHIKTGVKQGCILSPFLFIMAVDWLMNTTIKGKQRGIRWTLTSMLEDLDFADDLCLLSSRQKNIQEKTSDLDRNSQKIGLKVHTGKTKLLKSRSTTPNPVTIKGKAIEEVEVFTYLGSKMSSDGNSEIEVQARLAKARYAYVNLRPVWNSGKFSTTTKIRLFRSNVLSVLLYGAETWKWTKCISHSIEVFQNRCLRRIFKIFWPNTISNQDLLKRAGLPSLTSEIKRRRWRWMGHVLRMPSTALPRIALKWTPDGKRPRGRPKETWRRTMDREREEQGWTWGYLQKTAQDRPQWRALVEALCTTQYEED